MCTDRTHGVGAGRPIRSNSPVRGTSTVEAAREDCSETGSVRPVNDLNPRLQISVDDTCVVLVGEIDAHTAPDLAEHLEPLPGIDGDVTVDLEGVDFIDSSGLRLIVEAHQRAEGSSRRLVVRKPSAAVVRLFEISGLAGHLVVSDD